jgi:hypothetical protein
MSHAAERFLDYNHHMMQCKICNGKFHDKLSRSHEVMRQVPMNARAFSSEVGTGSHEENASK